MFISFSPDLSPLVHREKFAICQTPRSSVCMQEPLLSYKRVTRRKSVRCCIRKCVRLTSDGTSTALQKPHFCAENIVCDICDVGVGVLKNI